jgi:hypothetical protein
VLSWAAFVLSCLPGLWVWHWLWHLGEYRPSDFPWAPEIEPDTQLHIDVNHDWTGLA